MRLRLLSRLLIVFLLALLTCIPALADAIFEPNDTFYQSEFKNCVYNNRSYTANGSDGTITILKEPGSNETVETINNGNEFYVSFTYKDKNGVTWGVVMFNPDGSGNLKETDNSKAKSGWIRMTDLSLIYDYISFDDDHQNEYKQYTGNYDIFEDINLVVFWSYPGSGEIVLKDEDFKLDHIFIISQTYTDEEGRQWGYLDYYYGYRNVWVCISDPTGAGIEAAPTPAPTGSETIAPTNPESPKIESNVPQTPQITEAPINPSSHTLILTSEETPALPSAFIPTVHDDQTSMVILIAVIVAAVVIVTGVIIAVSWKKSAKKDKVIK